MSANTPATELRQKLEENPGKPEYIVTVHRMGYRFTG